MTGDPLNKLSNLLMLQKFVDSVEVATEFFFFWNEVVNFSVAISANRYRLGHLSSSEILFEPLVLVASARNQMMFRRSRFGQALAEPTNDLGGTFL